MKIDGLPREVRSILLDYDGTLIDIRPKWWAPIEKAFMDTAGFVPEEKLRQNVGSVVQRVPSKPSKLFMFKLIWGLGREGGLSRWQTLKFLRESQSNFKKSRYLNVPIEGALEFVEIAKQQGVKLAIVTTASKSEIDNAIKELDTLKGIPTVSRDDVDYLKPHPEPIEKALSMIGATSDHSVMIGDFSSDIEAGKNAGTMTIGLSSYLPEISLPGLKKAEPDLIIPFLADLKDRIETEISN